MCKNAPFESVEELRLVMGMTPELLYGEDSNLNGIMDPNENDGSATPPNDNADGRLEPGFMEYFTVWSREPNKRSDGSARISVNTTNNTELTSRLQELFGESRANEISRAATPPSNGFDSLLRFFYASGMTVQEFNQIAGDLTVTNANFVDGLVNVNTASAIVLNCLPGIGPDKGQELVNYRRGKTTNDLYSVAWVTQVLEQTNALQAGPYLTTFSYVYSADIAAVGKEGRGYRRSWFVIDNTEDVPKVIYRRDRGRLGWALGNQTWPAWLARKETR
jgi:hypothetical protein